ncbi:MAG: MFS transporter [Burkholderiaceae bacterium]|nr:MFS transporter [Burkholderiaceae bacterium]MEB2318792.1 MFS transporter [Pseudomonadota bacterium]
MIETGRGRIFYGWWMVAACLLIATLSWTLGVFGVSVYLYAITRLHGWSIGVVSSAITVFYLTGACLSMPVGSLIGRKGPRGVFTIGALAMGTSVALLGRVTEPWHVYAIFALAGVGYASLGTTALTTTLAPWFERHQGRAVTIALLGASFGGMLGLPLLATSIELLGFPRATLLAGAAVIALVLPLAWRVLRHRPQDLGLLPDGMKPDPKAPAAAEPRRWNRASAVATLQFRTSIAAFGLALMVQLGFLTHHVAVAAPTLGATGAAGLVSATAIAAFIGRLLLARFSDAIDVRLAAAAMFGLGTVFLTLLAFAASPTALVLASLGYGITIGNVTTLSPIIVRREFGSASFGAIYGVGAMIIGLLSCLGPSLYGWLHDLSGSYRLPFLAAAAIEVMATVVILYGRPRA